MPTLFLDESNEESPDTEWENEDDTPFHKINI